jgi:hypothetical protein
MRHKHYSIVKASSRQMQIQIAKAIKVQQELFTSPKMVLYFMFLYELTSNNLTGKNSEAHTYKHMIK